MLNLLQDYESVDVGKKTYSKDRGAPELVVADAPTRPKFGGRGLQSGKTYQYQEDDAETEQPQEHEKRTGKAQLLADMFGPLLVHTFCILHIGKHMTM